MKKGSAFFSLSFDGRRANLPWAIVIVIMLSVVLGILLTDTAEEMLAYLLVTFACGASAVLWASAGATGVPVLPAVSIMFFIYYAIPILRKNVTLSEFEPSEIINAATTVALFLGAA